MMSVTRLSSTGCSSSGAGTVAAPAPTVSVSASGAAAATATAVRSPTRGLRDILPPHVHVVVDDVVIDRTSRTLRDRADGGASPRPSAIARSSLWLTPRAEELPDVAARPDQPRRRDADGPAEPGLDGAVRRPGRARGQACAVSLRSPDHSVWNVPGRSTRL